MQKKLIWDIPLRLFHWLLVIALLSQWITSELGSEYMDWHFYIGYFTLGLIIFRLIWGFVGPEYARFSQFIYSPKIIWQYLILFVKGKNPKYTGHNPLGGLIVPAVILLVGAQAITGLFASDDVLSSGPYMSAVSSETQGMLDGLHHQIFNLILAIAGIHIVAILWYQFGRKIPLIGAMFSGKKADTEGKSIGSSKVLRAIIFAIIIAIFLYWLIAIAAPTPEVEYYF
ncbi:cytochrome b/b6 domain-containing protein [Aliiglaciecola lipolytica]|uniref:Cytochrome b561 family protein n=1 Tax=Aliiglaciecola lipolytica E3 TaxID=1127673 RepID=K6Y3T6_9ALTE|nr:cytochrome b/b6 domain-containing protein [Aliiglaciecola lipolytica]GAC12932.1 cytochrome b561 family protein [Aliiglaciecola lipolytica E3]